MGFSYIMQTSLVPRTKAFLKAIVKAPELVELDVSEFISLWGPHKISSFITIGANDGVRNDPLLGFIEKFNWQGILVEPMPENFKKLKANHQHNQNLILENVGIAEADGLFDFYYVKDIGPEDPDWLSQISSFNKETFYKNIVGVPDIESRIGVMGVPGITFDRLLSRHDINHIDLIMIDTEGFDYKILSSIDLKKYNPKMIVFEYEWLTNHEIKQAKRQLWDAGYRVIFGGFDCR